MTASNPRRAATGPSTSKPRYKSGQSSLGPSLIELNLRIVTLANQRAQNKHIENWKLESPFQVRKIAADELVEQRGLKGSVALAAIRELWKTPNEQGKRGSFEACSSCDERKKAQLPAIQAYIKKRGLKGPARLGASVKAKLSPRQKERLRQRPKEHLQSAAIQGTRTTSEVREIPKPSSEPSQG